MAKDAAGQLAHTADLLHQTRERCASLESQNKQLAEQLERRGRELQQEQASVNLCVCVCVCVCLWMLL